MKKDALRKAKKIRDDRIRRTKQIKKDMGEVYVDGDEEELEDLEKRTANTSSKKLLGKSKLRALSDTPAGPKDKAARGDEEDEHGNEYGDYYGDDYGAADYGEYYGEEDGVSPEGKYTTPAKKVGAKYKKTKTKKKKVAATNGTPATAAGTGKKPNEETVSVGKKSKKGGASPKKKK